MIITDSQSVSFGLLVMYVEDMYSAALGSLNPPADPRIAASGWSIVDYLTAQDVLIPGQECAGSEIEHQRREDAAATICQSFIRCCRVRPRRAYRSRCIGAVPL
jgi:hypothetical protein